MESTILPLAWYLPSFPTFAGALCATATFAIRRRLMRKKKPVSHNKCLGNRSRKYSEVSSLIKNIRSRKSLILHRKIHTFCKNSVERNIAERTVKSCPAKLEIQPCAQWNDFLEIINRYKVSTDVTFGVALSFWKLREAEKISEGAFGEVYTFQRADGSLAVLKCIPVDNLYPIKESQYTLPLTDIACTVSLSMLNNDHYLFTAPNFPEAYKICIVKDKFPRALMDTWLAYKAKAGATDDQTQFPQPDLDHEKRFVTLETSYCGKHLTREALKNNTWLAASIMTQLVSALAVAEEAFGLEHRDLHCGNVLLKQTTAPELKYTLRDRNFSVKTVWHQVFIIDFTVSRINDGMTTYSGFGGAWEGSSEQLPTSKCDWLDYEYVHAKMLDLLKEDDLQFHPRTNVFWLKYINETILDYLYEDDPSLRNLVVSSSDEGSDVLVHNHRMVPVRLLQKWNDCILSYGSATEFLRNVVLLENCLVEIDETA